LSSALGKGGFEAKKQLAGDFKDLLFDVNSTETYLVVGTLNTYFFYPCIQPKKNDPLAWIVKEYEEQQFFGLESPPDQKGLLHKHHTVLVLGGMRHCSNLRNKKDETFVLPASAILPFTKCGQLRIEC
jgi:hypothetical protein